MRPIALIGFVVLFPCASQAQYLPELMPGDRVRLVFRPTNDDLTGRFVRGTRDSLWLAYGDRADTGSFPLAPLRSVSVHRGKRHAIGEYALKGFLIGAAIGGTLGASLAIADPESAEFFDGLAGTTAFTAVLVGVPLGVIGGLFGISVDVWEPVRLR